MFLVVQRLTPVYALLTQPMFEPIAVVLEDGFFRVLIKALLWL